MNEEYAAYEAKRRRLSVQRDRLLIVIGEEMEKATPASSRVDELMAELAEVDSALQNLWEPNA